MAASSVKGTGGNGTTQVKNTERQDKASKTESKPKAGQKDPIKTDRDARFQQFLETEKRDRPITTDDLTADQKLSWAAALVAIHGMKEGEKPEQVAAELKKLIASKPEYKELFMSKMPDLESLGRQLGAEKFGQVLDGALGTYLNGDADAALKRAAFEFGGERGARLTSAAIRGARDGSGKPEAILTSVLATAARIQSETASNPDVAKALGVAAPILENIDAFKKSAGMFKEAMALIKDKDASPQEKRKAMMLTAGTVAEMLLPVVLWGATQAAKAH